MKFHPIADIFPLMNDEELRQLTADIEMHGQREKIIVFDNRIIDGRNRFLACERLGIETEVFIYEGDESRILDFVVSLNLHRRHLSESQRALVAARLASMERGRPQKNPSIEGLLSQKQAAEKLNVSVASVERAASVLKNGVCELEEKVEDGEISISRAAEIAALPKTKQMQIIRKGRKEGRKLAERLREKTVIDANKQTGVVCLNCNPQVAVTKENLLVHLTKLIERAPAYKRFFEDIVEELEADDFSEDYRDARDRILRAVDLGYQTEREIQDKTKIETKFLKYCLSVMLEYGVIIAAEQGGKTDAARGQRKTLFVRAASAKPEDLPEMNFGDEEKSSGAVMELADLH